MVASLTGYGRAECTDEKGRICVELKSVNNRFLQLDVYVPYGYTWADSRLRSLASEKIFRGKVLLRVDITDYAPNQDVVVNRPLLNKLLDLHVTIAKERNTPVQLNFDGLLALPGVMKCENTESDNEAAWERLKPVVEKAMKAFLEFRLREGTKLSEDMTARSKTLARLVGEIETRIPQYREKFIEKYTARIKELAGRADFDEARMATEIALWSDRSDISEEITRLKCHLEELEKVLKSSGQIGRKLDFLIQEIHRETNTTGNKIGDMLVIQQAMEMKCELEKIREQAQNLE